MTLDEALRECEEACPCLHMNYACGPLVCKCKIRIMAYSATATDTQPPTTNVLCSWPGHAAITRYGEACREADDTLTRNEERAITVVALENAIRNPGGTFQPPLEAVMVAHREALAAARLAGRLEQAELTVKNWGRSELWFNDELARLRKEAERDA